MTARFHGSLGATGKGHITDRATILGLLGHHPETVRVDRAVRALTLGCIIQQVENAAEIGMEHTWA